MPINKKSPFRQPTREETVAMLLVVEAELPDVMEPWRVLRRELETACQPGGVTEDEWKERMTPIQAAVIKLPLARGLADDGFHANNCFQCIGIVIGDGMGLGVAERYAFLRSDAATG